jgi:heme exporter protein A
MVLNTQMNKTMLETQQLTCERNHRFLFQDLSISLNKGEVLQIDGANGAGKSTLLKILAGLYEDFEGEVMWQVEDYPLYIGHKVGMKDAMSARENLMWLADLQATEVSQGDIVAALAKVSLAGYEDVLCGEMSEGQRKRVNLARLFLLHNPVWILDEPFSAIDKEGVACITDRIKEHLSDGGTVILTSHQTVDFPNIQSLTLS